MVTAVNSYTLGIYGETRSTTNGSTAVFGRSNGASGSVYGVWGESASPNGRGVLGFALTNSPNAVGVYGSGNVAVRGDGSGPSSTGVIGTGSIGVSGSAGVGVGVVGSAVNGDAANFFGRVGMGNDLYVNGDLRVSGIKNFLIDHPLDPANKYLYHAAIESSDPMNIYNGNAVLDSAGEAVIELPTWFEAVNKDFRYQLTAIGAPGPNLHIAQKVVNNRFKIAGGVPGGEVSWLVTGVRQDAWAKVHPLTVEQDKPAKERGFYLHPELFGAPEEKSIDWARHPELMRQLKGEAAKALEPIKP